MSEDTMSKDSMSKDSMKKDDMKKNKPPWQARRAPGRVRRTPRRQCLIFCSRCSPVS